MHADARDLNKVLEDSIVASLLSPYGQAIYFPKGIVAQSAEAGQKAYDINATAGVALEMGKPIHLSSISEAVPAFPAQKLVSYSPTSGDMVLRQKWQEEIIRKNPSLTGKSFSLPVVTAGLTHALSLAADLFVGQGDTVLIPEPCWDNYPLIFETRHNADLVSYPLFNRQNQLAIEELRLAVMAVDHGKVVVLLNFPNNPTGYTPTQNEWEALAEALASCALSGKHLVVLIDDAYFGLFHTQECARESMFAALCTLSGNLLAVKCDAATKEAMVWGFRVGFITFGAKGLSSAHYGALVQKTMGAIRSSVSSCSTIGQSLLVSALSDPRFHMETARGCEEMRERYRLVQRALELYRPTEARLCPLPFNSGYFFSFRCLRDAKILRTYLLETYGVGTVSIGEQYLRVAYSSVDRESIERFVGLVYRAAGEAWK